MVQCKTVKSYTQVHCNFSFKNTEHQRPSSTEYGTTPKFNSLTEKSYQTCDDSISLFRGVWCDVARSIDMNWFGLGLLISFRKNWIIFLASNWQQIGIMYYRWCCYKIVIIDGHKIGLLLAKGAINSQIKLLNQILVYIPHIACSCSQHAD